VRGRHLNAVQCSEGGLHASFQDALPAGACRELQAFQGRTVACKQQCGRHSITMLGVVHYADAQLVSKLRFRIVIPGGRYSFSVQQKSGITLCLNHRGEGSPGLEQLGIWQGLESSWGINQPKKNSYKFLSCEKELLEEAHGV